MPSNSPTLFNGLTNETWSDPYYSDYTYQADTGGTYECASGTDHPCRMDQGLNTAGTVTAGALVGTNINLSGVPLMSVTSPTISGFCTSPSITSNGTATLQINVGSLCSVSSGTITLPLALNGWNCNAENLTAKSSGRSDNTWMTAFTTTTVTLTNQTSSGGIANWHSSDVVIANCMAF